MHVGHLRFKDLSGVVGMRAGLGAGADRDEHWRLFPVGAAARYAYFRTFGW